MRSYIKFMISALCALLSSCFILIDENNYRGLPKKELSHYKPVSADSIFSGNKDPENLFIFEINSLELKKILTEDKFTWVHLWRPGCSGTSCLPPGAYSNIEKDYDTIGLRFLLISESYEYYQIVNSLKNSYYPEKIFVLEDAYYGHKNPEIHKKFFQDMNNNKGISYNRLFCDFLFKDTTLIYASSYLKPDTIPELFRSLTATSLIRGQ